MNFLDAEIGLVNTVEVIEPRTTKQAAQNKHSAKNAGSSRFCVDYRKLNAATTRDLYSLSRM